MTIADESIEADTRRVIERFFQLVNAQPPDPDRIAALFAEKVDWYIPRSEHMTWSGRRSRRGELPELFRALFAAFEPGGQVNVEAFLVDGKQVAVFCTVTRTVKANHRSFSVLMAQRFTVEDGLISCFHIHEETSLIEAALTAR